MKPLILSKEQIHSFVAENYKPIGGEVRLTNENKTVLFKAAEGYGFELDKKRTEKIFGLSDQISEKSQKQQYGAIFQVYGNYSLPAEGLVDTNLGKERIALYIFHATLLNKQNKYLAQELMKNNAVKLFPGCDEEYLYEVLSETTDEHFFETVRRLAAGVQMYEIAFEENGEFTIEEMERI